jgi:hypothetical protein
MINGKKLEVPAKRGELTVVGEGLGPAYDLSCYGVPIRLFPIDSLLAVRAQFPDSGLQRFGAYIVDLLDSSVGMPAWRLSTGPGLRPSPP